jgi:hypothetical protein
MPIRMPRPLTPPDGGPPPSPAGARRLHPPAAPAGAGRGGAVGRGGAPGAA